MGERPRMIGPYRVERLLGSGGMGVVYAAVEPGTGRLAAVKVIRPEWAAEPALRARLRREAAAAGRVPRSCTAAVLGADLDGDPPYIATELISGPTLDVRVLEEGPVRGDALVSLATGVAVALRAVHGCGVLHRDLKPPNIILSPAGPRVIDFGIARIDDAETRLTKVGGLIGTPAYMAPEQFLAGPELTKAADVFAWAGVVVYAATGLPPFGSGAGMRERILGEDPVLPALPGVLPGLVRRAFSKDPADRPTAAELVDALTRDSVPAGKVVRQAAIAPERRVRVASDLRPKGGPRPLARTSVVAAAVLVPMLLAASWLSGALRGVTGGDAPEKKTPLPGLPLLGHDEAVLAVAVTTLKGRPVAVSGGYDDALRVWDLTTRTQVQHVRYADDIRVITTGSLRGRPIAVAGVTAGDRGRFGLGSLGTALCAFDLATGEEVLKRLFGRATRAVAMDSRAIYHSGVRGTISSDPRGIERADLKEGRALPGLDVPTHYVEGLQTTTVDGRAVVVSLEERDGGNRVRVLDAGSLDVLRTIKAPAYSRELRVGRAGGRTIAVVSHDRGVLFWDLTRGRRIVDVPVPQSATGGPALAVGALEGRPVVVTGPIGGALVVRDLATGGELRTVPIGPLAPTALAMAEVGGGPVVIAGGGGPADRRLRVLPL
ncbi:serine/threonine-protein kinase [Actinocorallia longicatena]|uniref:Serine/threonine-protein kinase n=1 Tax=Actinocorallia longicatena TaxID=111803 RepID=A0ABP6QMP5_9ACTN